MNHPRRDRIDRVGLCHRRMPLQGLLTLHGAAHTHTCNLAGASLSSPIGQAVCY